MIEIRDTFQDAKIERRGGDVWGGGIGLPIPLGGLGERCKLPQWGPGQSRPFGAF